MKKVFECLASALLVVVILACAGIFVAPRFGWHVDIVYGGSMEPAMKTGSLVVIQPVEPEGIKMGDIITYRADRDSRMATSHRVIEIVPSEDSLTFHTKGDANEDADLRPVVADELVGKVAFHVPYVGYSADFARTRLGMILLICLPAAAIVGLELRNIRRTLSGKKGAGASDYGDKGKRIVAGTLSADSAVLERESLAPRVALGLGIAAGIAIIAIVVFFCAM